VQNPFDGQVRVIVPDLPISLLIFPRYTGLD